MDNKTRECDVCGTTDYGMVWSFTGMCGSCSLGTVVTEPFWWMEDEEVEHNYEG